MPTPARVIVLPADDGPLKVVDVELPDPAPHQVIVKQFAFWRLPLSIAPDAHTAAITCCSWTRVYRYRSAKRISRHPRQRGRHRHGDLGTSRC